MNARNPRTSRSKFSFDASRAIVKLHGDCLRSNNAKYKISSLIAACDIVSEAYFTGEFLLSIKEQMRLSPSDRRCIHCSVENRIVDEMRATRA